MSASVSGRFELVSVCENCGAQIDLSGAAAVRCGFCQAINAPGPKEVEVPVPVQVVNKVVQVMGSSPEAAELRCPHCRRKLVTVRVADVDLNGCGSCGGIWVDNAGAQHVVAKPQEVFAELAQRAARNAQHAGQRVTNPVCAVCPSQLDKVEATSWGIVLDICKEHGTWFDALELATLVHAINAPRAAPGGGRSANVACAGCGATIARANANISGSGPKCDACWRAEQDALASKPGNPEAIGVPRFSSPNDAAQARQFARTSDSATAGIDLVGDVLSLLLR